jgi:hypothetical protein
MPIQEVQTGPVRKALLAGNSNQATGSYVSRIPTVTEPIQDGVIDLWQQSAIVQRHVMVIPYGLGTVDDTFLMRILAWRLIGDYDTPKGDLWIPTVIGEYGCTLGALTGVAGAPILNTELFVDAITITSEGTYTAVTTRTGATRIYAPGDDLVAHLVVCLDGAQKVEFLFQQSTNTPTMNALVAFGDYRF